MKKWKKIILAVSAIVALAAVFAAVYLFICLSVNVGPRRFYIVRESDK